MKFKDYVKQQENIRANESKGSTDNRGGQRSKEDVDRIIDDYSKKSENELMSMLLKEVAKGKREGTLKDSDLEAFCSQVRPMLSKEQSEKLDEIILLIRD